MFEEMLLESGRRAKTRRGAATFISFIFQACLIGALVIVPLLFTETLPAKELVTFLVAPPPPPPPPPPALAPAVARVRVVRSAASDIANGQLRSPTAIPVTAKIIKEDSAPPAVNEVAGVVGGVPGGVPGGSMGGVIGGIIGSTSSITPVVTKVAATPPRVIRISSGISTGLCLEHPEPPYPPVARKARIHGQVVLEAEIGTDGLIHNLQLVSGHPMLVGSAMATVEHWRYRPYILNGEPVEVKTTIIVNFVLS